MSHAPKCNCTCKNVTEKVTLDEQLLFILIHSPIKFSWALKTSISQNHGTEEYYCLVVKNQLCIRQTILHGSMSLWWKLKQDSTSVVALYVTLYSSVQNKCPCVVFVHGSICYPFSLVYYIYTSNYSFALDWKIKLFTLLTLIIVQLHQQCIINSSSSFPFAVRCSCNM